MSEKKLFTEFPPVSTAQWEEIIVKDLKGADYERRLVWRTDEGFNVRPYYRSENLTGLQYLNTLPGEFPFVRGKKIKNNSWEIRQDFNVECEAEANVKAVEALEKGATSVGFNFCSKGKVRELKMNGLLKGICPGKYRICFDGGVNSVSLLQGLLDHASANECQNVKGVINFDPLGSLVKRGHYYGASDFPLDTLKQLLDLSASHEDIRVIGIDAYQFQNAGSTLVQELAFALAMGAEYLTRLTNEGYDADAVAEKIVFNFGVGTNYFMEMAKMRAARLLWANLVKAYQPKSEASAYMFIHAKTTSLNATVYDPYVNLLRSSTESMAAVLSGVDALTVLPFDRAYKSSDEFSERLARNQQIILKEESHFDKIVDPGAGSYYIENLTASIADNAWALFLQIQDEGGFVAAMQSGSIQNKVQESAAKRLSAMATRKEVLLGTNQYANTIEFAKDRVSEDFGKGCGCQCQHTLVATPIKPIRLASAYEDLRLQTERSGRRPKVFMLTIGNLAMRKARSGFACNFFSAAGYEVIDNNGFATIAEGYKAAAEAKADIVVLCSSDDEYPTFAAEAVQAAAGKFIFVLAGYPKALIEQLKADGVVNFIYAGQNVLEALQGYQQQLGIR